MQALAASFFLQMAAILLACRVVGWLGKKIGQPQVVGEMIAGVLLGLISPEVSSKLFTPETRGILYVGAQLGVGLYMFLVGMEFKIELFRSRARSAASVSIAGMLVPFILGGLLAPWLLKVPGLFAAKTEVYQAGLFMGAAIAITAFPMLARIIYERGLSGTSLGTLALAAGAIDDAAAWCVLAIVLASFGGGESVFLGLHVNPAVLAIAGGFAYAAFMLTGGKRLLARLGTIAEREGGISPTLLAVVLILFSLSAWFTDTIGIHAVFGGFILGIAMPRGIVAKEVTEKLEPFTVIFLLPMFFTFSGLNTRLDVILQPSILLVAVVVLLASTLGKGVACWAAARLNGEDNRTSLAIGALMNSRGLMELIIINIGFQKGVIGTKLFAILVIMAIVTTLMASPVFEWVYGRHLRKC
jgi:Kef-type K+ transport system membrane component KefB